MRERVGATGLSCVVTVLLMLGCGARGSLLGETTSATGGEGGGTTSGPSSTAPSGPGTGGGSACSIDGAPCEQSADCCSELCDAGVCVAPKCLPPSAPCVAPTECCGGVCEGGVCDPSACLLDGQSCGSDLECCAGVCGDGVCGAIVECRTDGSFCQDGFECCSGLCDFGVCAKGTCDHDACTVGTPLSPSCDPCAQAVCTSDPFCCQSGWDELCVTVANDVCGPCECLPASAGCMQDSDCCSGTCDAGRCIDPTSQCAHDVCETGVALDAQACGGCVSAICANDPVCCNGGWDQFCVSAVPTTCGIDCPGACTPDGSMCNAMTPCCSGSCVNGICGGDGTCNLPGEMCNAPSDCCSGFCTEGKCQGGGGSCSQDGASCSNASDCCSGACIAGRCGNVTCPSDGSACGNCVASSCCGEVATCATNFSCAQDLGAFVACASQGTDPLTCFFDNVDDPRAFDAAFCFIQSCAASCF
jgi:hypothetical protein